MTPFIASGAHNAQSSSRHSSLATLLDAFSQCRPPIIIRPSLLRLAATEHGLWHRALTLLERQSQPGGGVGTGAPSERTDALSALCAIYEHLCEWDAWRAVWQTRGGAAAALTGVALAYAQAGCQQRAVETLELCMSRVQQQLGAVASS